MGRQWRVSWCSGEQERRWRGLGVGDVYRWLWEREACCRSLGEGDADMGRRWRAWWRSVERERRERGPRESWWRLGEQEPCE